MENLPVRGIGLPSCVGEILRPDEPAMEGPGTPILAVAADAIFCKQPSGIHLVGRIIGLLRGQWPRGGAALNQQGNSPERDRQEPGGDFIFHIQFLLVHRFSFESCSGWRLVNSRLRAVLAR